MDIRDIEWRHSHQAEPYGEALAEMEARVAAIRTGEARPQVWLLEHPPLYTAGTSARKADLLDAARFPVHEAGRGGEYTYHGPGQRVAYAMLDLKTLFAPEPPDLRRYIQLLERWLVAVLAEFGVEGFIREGRVGVWVQPPRGGPEAKIAAIGVRVRQWVSYHGVALNVNPDLGHYAGIVPCGIQAYGVTSLAEMGVGACMREVDAALARCFGAVFGRA